MIALLKFFLLLVAIVLGWGLSGVVMFWIADRVRERLGHVALEDPPEEDVAHLDWLDRGQ